MQAQDLQRIIADLIDKFQNDLDTERRRATAEMEELLYAFFAHLSLFVCQCLSLFSAIVSLSRLNLEEMLGSDIACADTPCAVKWMALGTSKRRRLSKRRRGCPRRSASWNRYHQPQ